MKQRILIMLLLASFFACKKDYSATNSTASMSAKVNGVTWTAENNIDLSIFKDGNVYVLYGATKNEEEAIWVRFPKLEKGEFLLNDNANGKYGIYENKAGKQYYSYQNGNGRITVTDISNNTASGTFNFTANGLTTPDSVIITDGVFKNIKVE